MKHLCLPDVEDDIMGKSIEFVARNNLFQSEKKNGSTLTELVITRILHYFIKLIKFQKKVPECRFALYQ